jgi:3-hydroxyisobutyrate dehydrogenase
VTNVAVLGTGVMGGAIARRLAQAGMAVRGWSVPIEDAEALRADGVDVAETAAAAVAGASVVITMAPNADAIESFADGPDGFLPAMHEHAVWLQMSTVGVAPADRLIALARSNGVRIVDSPVLGSKEPAERGELLMLCSGKDDEIDLCEPLFSVLGRRVFRLGPAGAGSRMKMVTNHWIMAAVGGLAETMALATALDVDGSRFLAALEGTQMDMGYAQVKGRMMLERSYPTHGNLANGEKDARLAHEAARDAKLPGRISGAVAELMSAALAIRPATDDMAAAYEAAIGMPQKS